MTTHIDIGDIAVEVILKDIKNIHLSVCPPLGHVKISAPVRMNLDHIRVYAISRLGWIRQQQQKLRAQARETPREYLNRESHLVWGKRYLLEVRHHNAAPSVEVKHSRIVLSVRPGADAQARRAVLEDWYRQQIKSALAPLISKWTPLLGVSVKKVFVQRMKTKWGACTPERRNIRINSELAKKPPECLEYIVVHEMAHLQVRQHNDRFRQLLDQCLPNWRVIRDALNEAALAHVDWEARR